MDGPLAAVAGQTSAEPNRRSGGFLAAGIHDCGDALVSRNCRNIAAQAAGGGHEPLGQRTGVRRESWARTHRRRPRSADPTRWWRSRRARARWRASPAEAAGASTGPGWPDRRSTSILVTTVLIASQSGTRRSRSRIIVMMQDGQPSSVAGVALHPEHQGPGRQNQRRRPQDGRQKGLDHPEAGEEETRDEKHHEGGTAEIFVRHGPGSGLALGRFEYRVLGDRLLPG